MNIWDTCSRCGACCHSQGLEDIVLSEKEQEYYGVSELHCDNGRCPELGPNGCKQSPKTRPLVCKMYPFIYVNGRISIDMGCPLASTLLIDLQTSPSGVAATMLRGVRKELDVLNNNADPVLDQMSDFHSEDLKHLNMIYLEAPHE